MRRAAKADRDSGRGSDDRNRLSLHRLEQVDLLMAELNPQGRRAAHVFGALSRTGAVEPGHRPVAVKCQRARATVVFAEKVPICEEHPTTVLKRRDFYPF
jgi:hypothetical protein